MSGRIGGDPFGGRETGADQEGQLWSASAGAVYPLLDRLAAEGWLEFEERDFGTRKRKSYRLTRAGRRQLKRWLSGPDLVAAAAHTHDPLRTRVFFLGMVSSEERRSFIEDAIAKTTEVLDRHRADLKNKRPRLSEWDICGREGAIRELTARLDWLREIPAG